MKAVEGFVKENRGALSRNIKGLNRVSKVLVKQRAALDEILQVAPTALSNLFHTYNPATGTLDTRTNVGENLANLTTDPVGAVCSILAAGTGRQHLQGLQHAARRRCPGPPRSAGPADRGDGHGRRARRPVPRRDPGGASMSHAGRAAAARGGRIVRVRDPDGRGRPGR